MCNNRFYFILTLHFNRGVLYGSFSRSDCQNAICTFSFSCAKSSAFYKLNECNHNNNARNVETVKVLPPVN